MQYGYYPNSYFQQYQPQSMQAQTTQPPVNSMGGFIPVQNENEARMYPIAPGTSATFIDENSPYCYTKTLGASQLDRPTFSASFDTLPKTFEITLYKPSGYGGIVCRVRSVCACMGLLRALNDARQPLRLPGFACQFMPIIFNSPKSSVM